VVTVPNAYTKDWIERHLLTAMTETLGRIFRRPAELQFIVWNPVDAEAPASTPLLTYLDDLIDEPPEGISHALNPAYTFDSFVVGDANRYAALLARAVIESPVGKYSPVLFYGGMGMGKTHLLQSIARALSEQRHRVVCLTAEEFTTELVAAIRGHEMVKFRDKFRQADAVLIDDLQFIEGKDNTQSELVAIWDTLRNRQRTLIFAADRLPRDMVKVSADARSRFQAGPIAMLDAPDWQLRCDILDHKSAARGLPLPTEVRDLIAERLTASVRELEGALDQLHTFHHLTAQDITLRTAGQALAALGFSAPPPPDITVNSVLAATAAHYRLSVEDLASRKRTKLVALARQIAMYLAREETTASLSQIGAALGGRDHTTILHGCARIMPLMLTDREVAHDVRAIRALMRQQSSPMQPSPMQPSPVQPAPPHLSRQPPPPPPLPPPAAPATSTGVTARRAKVPVPAPKR
jgi:chromosomal replication initiator protein